MHALQAELVAARSEGAESRARVEALMAELAQIREHTVAQESAAAQARDHFHQRAEESGASVRDLNEQLRSVREHAAARDRTLAEAREARERLEHQVSELSAQAAAQSTAHGQRVAELERELTELRTGRGERDRELGGLRSRVADLDRQLESARRETAALRRRADRLSALQPRGRGEGSPVALERKLGLFLLVLGAVATGALAYGFLHFVALG